MVVWCCREKVSLPNAMGLQGRGSLKAQTLLSWGSGLVLGPEKPTFSVAGSSSRADESRLSRKDVTFCRVTTSEMPQSFESPCSRVRLPLGSTATASVMSLALKT